jgi:hypothetical protein
VGVLGCNGLGRPQWARRPIGLHVRDRTHGVVTLTAVGAEMGTFG